MHSLDRLLGDPFFDLLEAGADEARRSVRLLTGLLRSGNQQGEEFSECSRKSERLATDIGARLAKTIVASLKKEDIETLSMALRKIPELADRFGERFALARD